MCERGFIYIFRKAICKVDMLIGHANICVMRQCNLVSTFLQLLPSLLDTSLPGNVFFRKATIRPLYNVQLKGKRLQAKCLVSTRLQTTQAEGKNCTALNIKPESLKFPKSYNL
jgi:hypothetical protein